MENETNKSYRIRTNINKDSNVLVNFTQEYETFELLSIKMKTENLYRLHNANYGIIVGRVQANGGFGVPNAKISIFIEVDQDNENAELLAIYGYTDVFQTNSLGNTYNLLPDEQVSDCHKKIGAFPSKRYLLDNDTYIEVYDKYYKYTTRTNDAGDYIIVGVPVGNQTLHMDLDLSDCGILSQRPRDFVYKGYNIEQFDNPNQFKSETGASINFLSQYVQQTKTVYVNPLWGNNELGETIGITRADVDVNFKFEPTCVFMGSIVSDSRSNGISKKCVPTDQMGVMDELTTGKGTIEMIRKTPTGDVEEFQIKGNELIDGNGTWCYQIPMNLDYVTTNEYGETVATDNPNIGIPTRARVRFRVSLDNFEDSNDNFFAGKILVPNNPKVVKKNRIDDIDYDYAFGTNTGDDSYRDLFWNNVYSVKQHIPRIQKSGSWRTDRFTGIKQCNFYGQNNPIPYNSIRIKLPFMFVVLCALIKTYVRIVAFLNAIINAFFQVLTVFMYIILTFVIALLPVLWVIYLILKAVSSFIEFFGGDPLDLDELEALCKLDIGNWRIIKRLEQTAYITIADGICPDLDSWYFAPALLSKGMDFCFSERVNINGYDHTFNICEQTINKIANEGDDYEDVTSTDKSNKDTGVDEKICITKNIDYLMTCIEMNLAQEYKVIKFDFYNDWINGMLYIPRWKFRPEHKITFLFGLIKFKVKTRGCFDDNSLFGRTRWLTQHCSLGYKQSSFSGGYIGYSKIGTKNGCSSNKNSQKCHKGPGVIHTVVFGAHGGLIHQEKTMLGQTVYYYKPSEMTQNSKGAQTKVNMFATDIILLGSLKDCDENGVPQAFKWLSSSSYKMPTNLALTNLDESGVLFVDDGSYCKGGTNDKMETKKVSVAENSFSGQIKWSSTAPVEIQIMGYGGGPNPVENVVNTASDKIAITEAAGISWDYTGPSQAERSDNDLFSPGGHFLGMSCVNSKTNIKSCVNLQRICEAGATMSERIERTKGLKLDKNGNYKQQSVIFSPNGLISTDEIIAGSFRSMFATMNVNPLIATRKDENTGYLTYDFTYLRANGFDGSAQSGIVSKSSNYNFNLYIPYIKAQLNPENYVYDKNELYSTDDIDEEEYTNTYHRSIEATNFGYYRFRFGLRNSEPKQFNSDATLKYALTYNGLKYLPQYENSFYFYFGLKDGNTALDRFYSDFFSMCPTKQPAKKPSIKIKDAGMNYCVREQGIWITCENIEYPYDIELRSGSTIITAPDVTFKSANICGLAPGVWTITVKDSSGLSISKKVSVGSNLKGIDYNLNDFKEELDGYHLDTTSRLVNGNGQHPKGGEFRFNLEDLTVFGGTIGEFIEKAGTSNVGLLFVSSTSGSPSIPNYAVMAKYVTSPVSSNTISIQGQDENNRLTFEYETFDSSMFYDSSVMKQGEQDRHKTDFEFGQNNNVQNIGEKAIEFTDNNVCIYLWGDDRYYTLYFIYDVCGTGKYCALELCRFFSYGYSSFNVYLGSKFLKYNGKNSEGFSLSTFLSKKDVLGASSYSDIIDEIRNSGSYKTQWALRQALFDQRYDIAEDSSDRLIRCTNLNGEYIDGFLFGQPERVILSGTSIIYDAYDEWQYYGKNTPLSSEDYASYPGYDIDDTASLLPSIGYTPDETTKLPYFRMSYDLEQGIVLSKPLYEITVTDVDNTEEGIFIRLIYTKNSGVGEMSDGRAYILQNKDVMIGCSCCSNDEDKMLLVSKDTWNNTNINLGESGVTFSVMPTLVVPIIHRPFYFESYPFILGQFTVMGNQKLSIKFNERGSQKRKAEINNTSYEYTILSYGDKELSYKLERESDVENKVTINDYIRIYGGNACGPKYHLSTNSKHFGEALTEPIGTSSSYESVSTVGGGNSINMGSGQKRNAKSPSSVASNDTVITQTAGEPISIASNVTGSSIDAYVEKVCQVKITQPDTLEINLSTGKPSLAYLNDEDKRTYEELMAFANGNEKNLEFSTSYAIDNFLPKEIVIRKKKITSDDDVDGVSLIKEDKYLDVGEMDNFTSSDVNKYVKFYMVIMPDNGNFTNIKTAMETCIFSDNVLKEKEGRYRNLIFSDLPSYDYYKAKTANEILSRVTFSDYFSNPNSVAFLFDQLINSSHFTSSDFLINDADISKGRFAGGYFGKPSNSNYKDPGIVFGEATSTIPPMKGYKLKSPFLTNDFNPNEVNIISSESTGRIAAVKGIGKNEYASIDCCLSAFTHSEMNGKSMLEYLKGSKLCKCMEKFGFNLSIVTKFDRNNESKYPTYSNGKTIGIYINKLAEKLGFNSGDASIGSFNPSEAVLQTDCFDKIIGRNWSFPNIEYSVDNNRNTADASTYKSFAKKISDEYERVSALNKEKTEGDVLETPNYAKIIAEFFINSSYTTNKNEDETIEDLFRLACNSSEHESFIIPIKLGENRDEDGVLQSSFIWSGNNSTRYKVYMDKMWVVNDKTNYILGHNRNNQPTSHIEDSIYDENLSHGFRSVIIGIYDGPEDGYNSVKDTENKTGNVIRPFKIYTYHNKGLSSTSNLDSKINNTHQINGEFKPNDYRNKRLGKNGKQTKENLGLYYYHTYENDYDQYASGWC